MTTLTYGQLLAISVAFAKRLKKITSNRRVGIILPPGKGAAIANLGCLFAGKTPVNFNYSASEGAFASSVKQSGVDWFITADTFMRKLQNFPWPPQRDLILMEREIPLLKGSAKRWGLAIKFLTAGFMIKKLGLDAPTGADEAVLMFTSGSSGEPKGVPLTHHNLLSNISQCSSRITLEPQSRFLGSLPVFHCFGITIGLWYPMIGGYDMVTYPSPLEAKRLGALIKQYGISLVVTTPTFLRGFMKRCEPDTFKTVRYLIVGAEKLPEDLSAAFREKFGIIPCEGYGLTEASPVCSVNFIDPAPSNAAGDFIPGMKKSSVGALLPGIAIRITSPHTGRVVPITTSGMIWLKGPNIFPGYLGGPETDRDIFVDGWLKTGDIGSADEFGFLKIEGRISRFSKIGGEMVPHEALEAAIMNIWNLDPADEERRIAVVTIPDPVKGEAVALLTTLVTDYVHQARTLIRHGLIDQGLPALWCPKEIIPVERIPVLPSGKLDIKQCRMLAYEALNIPFEP